LACLQTLFILAIVWDARKRVSISALFAFLVVTIPRDFAPLVKNPQRVVLHTEIARL
jgi:hypothetical protein